MFTQLFDPLLKQRDQVLSVANELANWAFFKTYQDTLFFIEYKAVNVAGLSDEVRRVPELLDHVLWLLKRHIRSNIQPKNVGSVRDKLFAYTELGDTYQEFIRWVDRGWQSIRTPANYEKRYGIWKWYYDHTNRASHYYITMYKRMRYARYTMKIPYAMVWNYGSHYMTGREGYPNHTGIHFLEYAQHRLERNNQIALQQYQQYCSTLLATLGENPRFPSVLRTADWEKYKQGSFLYTLIGGNI